MAKPREYRNVHGKVTKRPYTPEELDEIKAAYPEALKLIKAAIVKERPHLWPEVLSIVEEAIDRDDTLFVDEFFEMPIIEVLDCIRDEAWKHPRSERSDSWASIVFQTTVILKAWVKATKAAECKRLESFIFLGMALERMRSKEIHQSKGSRPPTIAKMQRDVAECDRIIARYIQKAGVTKEVAWRHCWETDEKPRRDKTLPPLPISKRSYQEYKKKLKIGAASEQLH